VVSFDEALAVDVFGLDPREKLSYYKGRSYNKINDFYYYEPNPYVDIEYKDIYVNNNLLGKPIKLVFESLPTNIINLIEPKRN
jgi:hypothetical protein